jgi:hypothetical protein
MARLLEKILKELVIFPNHPRADERIDVEVILWGSKHKTSSERSVRNMCFCIYVIFEVHLQKLKNCFCQHCFCPSTFG